MKNRHGMGSRNRIDRSDRISASQLNEWISHTDGSFMGGSGSNRRSVDERTIISTSDVSRRDALHQTGPESGIVDYCYCLRNVPEYDDYLKTRWFTQDLPSAAAQPTANDILVAKPYFLRRSTFDGQTITYADGVEVSYHYLAPQIRLAYVGDTLGAGRPYLEGVCPLYGVEHLIRVARMVGGTGVIEEGGDHLIYEDRNIIGRTWAAIHGQSVAAPWGIVTSANRAWDGQYVFFTENGFGYARLVKAVGVGAGLAAGGRVWESGTQGTGDGQFQAPRGVAIYDYPVSRIWVVDLLNDRVQEFDADGDFVAKWGTTGTADGEFDQPYGIAIHPETEKLYVADGGNDRVQVFDLDGNHESTFGSSGDGDGEFTTPQGVAIYGDEVFVADYGNDRVQVFDLDGTFVRRIGGLPRQYDGTRVPTSLEIPQWYPGNEPLYQYGRIPGLLFVGGQVFDAATGYFVTNLAATYNASLVMTQTRSLEPDVIG